MIQKLLFVFCFITVTAVISQAQTRTITNADLEKYRQERLKAEADLRLNYARLGFPSPEELARRNAQSAKEAQELSARLQREAIERERLQTERAAAESRAIQQNYVLQRQTRILPIYSAHFYYWWKWKHYGVPPVIVPYQQPGYFAGGMFIPTGPSEPPQPLFRVNLRPR